MCSPEWSFSSAVRILRHKTKLRAREGKRIKDKRGENKISASSILFLSLRTHIYLYFHIQSSKLSEEVQGRLACRQNDTQCLLPSSFHCGINLLLNGLGYIKYLNVLFLLLNGWNWVDWFLRGGLKRIGGKIMRCRLPMIWKCRHNIM